jgi:PEP-CTERM motif
MMSFKQFSASLVAVAAAAVVAPAMAAVQPINATSATVLIDSATLSANLAGYAVAAVGSATYNATTGILTDPVASVSTSTNPGPITVALDASSGLKFTKLFSPTITLSGFSMDAATGELFGNMKVASGIITVIDIQNQSVLKATSFVSSLGTSVGTSVSNSTVKRDLGLSASNFVLSESFIDYMANTYNLDANQFGYLAGLVKEVKIGTVYKPVGAVPEPSTYALMGLGLVGMAFVARRKQQA